MIAFLLVLVGLALLDILLDVAITIMRGDPMSVYLSRQLGYGEDHPVGVFSTYELAQEACQRVATGSLWWGELEDRSASSVARGEGWIYRIDEFTLDGVAEVES